MHLVKEENEKLVEYHDIIYKEEIYWRQRYRSIWLKEGDRNTKIFHLSTLKHSAKNRISGLTKGRHQITNEKEISNEMVSFFSSLLSSDPDIDQIKLVDFLDSIPSLVTKEQNTFLCSIPKGEEIFKVVFSLEGDKSPRPNGSLRYYFRKSGNYLVNIFVALSNNSLGKKNSKGN